jgi:16S rRNA (adenine1518-N6/adenine1519-N6)-dimethyltransferase
MQPQLYNESYLKNLSQKYSLVPSKKYGQNFLLQPEVIAAMVEVGEVEKDDVVVEVGPGFGVLTLALAEKAKQVIAFEIEKKLTPYWNDLQKKYKNIEIVWGNVLYEFENQAEIQTKPYSVIANLPYQITSLVMRKFLETAHKPRVLVLMVQKEVAERICAQAGDMSVLALSVQYYGRPEIVMQVPRSYFWPVPAVDSAVIKININHEQHTSAQEDERFFKIVKTGFVSRRKMLIKNIGGICARQKAEKVFEMLGLNPKARPQELSVQQWRDLAQAIFS